MDEINKIRKAFFSQGETKNSIAKRFNRSWDTINRIVSKTREELMNRGSRPNRKAKIMTAEIIQSIEAYLDEEKDKKVKKKQRYTARKIYNDLLKDGFYKGSERRIQDAVKKLREKRSQAKKKSFLPLSFSLGSTLQIDHGEADLIIGKGRVKGYLFVASVPGESLRYCQIFPTKAQEAWGEFHERVFRFFEGIFTKVVYDNDSTLIKKVAGDNKYQTNFSLSLEEHFGFESHFCNIGAGNEKGSVENGVGYCRRNFLAGLSSFISWDEANRNLETLCLEDILEGSHYKNNKSLKLIFEELKDQLKPLPPRKTWSRAVDCRVNSYQLISISNHNYSVPERYVGTHVKAALGIFKLEIFKDEEWIASHERKYGDEDSLYLDHYLDQLQYKAAAFWDCKAVNNNKFDHKYLEIWRRLSERQTKKEANRQFVKVLLLGRKYSQKDLLKAIEVSLKYGAINHSAIENILRQQEVENLVFNEEDLKKELNPEHVFSWNFDLTPYAELCKGVV